MIRQGTKYAFFLMTGLLCGLLQAAPAAAQQCDILAQEIVTLKEPYFGIPTMWNATYGEDGMEQFADGVIMDDGGMIAGGSFTVDKEDKVYHPLIVRLDDRGRKMWEVREVTKEHKTIDRIIKTKDGLSVIGDIKNTKRGDGIYIAHYTMDGKKKSQREIFEDKGNLNAKAVVAVSNGQSFIIAADLLFGANETQSEGLLYRINSAGGTVWRRAYSPGSKTSFNNVQALPDGTYMVSGQMRLEDSRMGAWLIRIGSDGGIIWQRSYPRGSFSSINAVIPRALGGFVTAGQTKPSGGGRGAAWLMEIDSSGIASWQRYYIGRYNYTANDLVGYEGGRIIALLDGDPQDYTDRAHVRLLTLTSTGSLMNVENYTEGQNANAASLKKSEAGEILITGHAQTSLPEGIERKDMTLDDVEPYMFDGWAVMAPPLEPYTDPCMPAGISR